MLPLWSRRSGRRLSLAGLPTLFANPQAVTLGEAGETGGRNASGAASVRAHPKMVQRVYRHFLQRQPVQARMQFNGLPAAGWQPASEALKRGRAYLAVPELNIPDVAAGKAAGNVEAAGDPRIFRPRIDGEAPKLVLRSCPDRAWSLRERGPFIGRKPVRAGPPVNLALRRNRYKSESIVAQIMLLP